MEEVVDTTTDAREAVELAMVDAIVMENGTKPVEHTREMIVVTAMARTAADRAAIAGAVVATATSRSQRTIAGRNLQGILMGTTVEVEETDMEMTVVEEVAAAMTGMEAVEAVEEADVVRRIGRNRLRGTKELKWSSLAPGRAAAAGSTSTGTRIFRLKRPATTFRLGSNPLPRWSSRL